MEKDARIYIAGHRGMVGSAMLRRLRQAGFTNFITRTSAELDLRNQAAAADFFAQEKPDYVVLAAANSGYLVDGQRQPLTSGKIQLQSEAAEVFYKGIMIKPLAAMPAQYAKYFK